MQILFQPHPHGLWITAAILADVLILAVGKGAHWRGIMTPLITDLGRAGAPTRAYGSLFGGTGGLWGGSPVNASRDHKAMMCCIPMSRMKHWNWIYLVWNLGVACMALVGRQANTYTEYT